DGVCWRLVVAGVAEMPALPVATLAARPVAWCVLNEIVFGTLAAIEAEVRVRTEQMLRGLFKPVILWFVHDSLLSPYRIWSPRNRPKARPRRSNRCRHPH